MPRNKNLPDVASVIKNTLTERGEMSHDEMLAELPENLRYYAQSRLNTILRSAQVVKTLRRNDSGQFELYYSFGGE